MMPEKEEYWRIGINYGKFTEIIKGRSIYGRSIIISTIDAEEIIQWLNELEDLKNLQKSV